MAGGRPARRPAPIAAPMRQELVRLVPVVSVASEWAPADTGQADRPLSVIFDGLRQAAPGGGQTAPVSALGSGSRAPGHQGGYDVPG